MCIRIRSQSHPTYMQSSTTRCTQHHKINESRATRIILRLLVGSNFKLVCRSIKLPHHPHTFPCESSLTHVRFPHVPVISPPSHPMYSPISHPGRLAVAVTSARGIGSAIYAACGNPPPHSYPLRLHPPLRPPLSAPLGERNDRSH